MVLFLNQMMEDSEIVTFGPQSSDENAADETLQEQLPRGSEMTERAAEAVKTEMRRLTDECMNDFSNKLEQMFNRFEQNEQNRPILGRGQHSTPRSNKCWSNSVNNDADCNNSHAASIVQNSTGTREKVEINCKVKPQLYDGSDDLEEYLTQFNLLAELNNWNTKTKALFLASSLNGVARAILNEISEPERHCYESLVDALKSRFGSANRSEVFRAELQTRVRFRNETLPELAQAIKKLTRRAYPGTSPVVRDTLALDYFIDAIPETEIRLRLREIGPKTISEAENIAVRLEALRVADRQKGKSVRTAEAVVEGNDRNELQEIRKSLKSLQNDVSSLKKNESSGNFRNGNFNKRQNNGQNNFGNFRHNPNFKRSENDQGSSSRVGTRQNPRGPTQ